MRKASLDALKKKGLADLVQRSKSVCGCLYAKAPGDRSLLGHCVTSTSTCHVHMNMVVCLLFNSMQEPRWTCAELSRTRRLTACGSHDSTATALRLVSALSRMHGLTS
jgi:hypothetical protein